MTAFIQTIKTRLSNYNSKRLSWIIAIEIAVVMVIASFFLQGGDDLYRYYLQVARGCLDCGFTPYYSYWFLYPLQFIPPDLLFPFWTIVTVSGLLILCRFTGINPMLLFLSFPTFGQVWLGQIDILICLGLTLALLGKKPYLRGIGITLALIKPQYAGVAVIYLLTKEKQRVKTLLIPAAVFALSLIVFGITWPIEWIQHSISNLPPHVWRLAAHDTWWLGVLLLWVPFLFEDRRERFEVGTIVSALSSPFIGVYSYIIFLLFNLKKWWFVPLSFAWFLAYPFMQENSLRFAWVLPMAMLGDILYRKYKTNPSFVRLRGRFVREKTGG